MQHLESPKFSPTFDQSEAKVLSRSRFPNFSNGDFVLTKSGSLICSYRLSCTWCKSKFDICSLVYGILMYFSTASTLTEHRNRKCVLVSASLDTFWILDLYRISRKITGTMSTHIPKPPQINRHKKCDTTNAHDFTMLGAVYKICLICFVEAIKLIGETLTTVIATKEENGNGKSKEKCSQHNTTKLVPVCKKNEASALPPMPHRSKSKVLKTLNVNPAWLLKSRSLQESKVRSLYVRMPWHFGTTLVLILQATQQASKDTYTTVRRCLLSKPETRSTLRRRCSTYPGCFSRSASSPVTTTTFGRSLNLSRRLINRRHSYPPFKSFLEIVQEEEEEMNFV